jgi:iron complex outermembrane receptor protein
LHIADLKVGDAAQTTLALGASYKFGSNTRLTLDYNYFDDLYSDFNPSARGVDSTLPQAEIDAILATDAIQPWKVPAYGVFDTAFSHSFPFGKFNATLVARMNNIFDTRYVADALDGGGSNAQTALVYYGFGRTFSVGATIKF